VSSYCQGGFAATLRGFLQDDGLADPSVLSGELLEKLCEEEDVHFGDGSDDVYTPAITLWAWLCQCLSTSKSCVAAVARILVLRVAMDLPPCSAGTGAYCKARVKLPERFLKRLALHVGTEMEANAPDCWRWKSRRVILADGAECTMPDTSENQKEYPQSSKQKPGLGFPMIRLVVLLAFATAGLLGCAMGPHKGKETGETALFRELLEAILADDVVVADRLYCSYWTIAAVTRRGAEATFRLHQSRHYDFRKGQRLGAGDHIVTWHKPARPEWMDEDEYAAMPDTLQMREIRVVVTEPGRRTRVIIVATTMTDAEVYSKKDIADLYSYRWHVELDIRAIKQTLRMDILTCQTPEMVRKEIWMHLLAYNLVRQTMAAAARQEKMRPRQVSFAGAMQTMNAFRWLLLLSSDGEQRARFRLVVMKAVSTHQVGNRPGRCEPRETKRRPKSFPRLMKPREQRKAELLGQKG
jgi:hypothetical protein